MKGDLAGGGEHGMGKGYVSRVGMQYNVQCKWEGVWKKKKKIRNRIMGKGYVARVGMQYYVCIMYMGGGELNTEKKNRNRIMYCIGIIRN